MIYSKLIESNSPLQLAANLETFLTCFNKSVESFESERILFITQSETSNINMGDGTYSGTGMTFNKSKKEWHGTITVVYEAKRKIEYN